MQNAHRVGAALGLTLAVFYALCSLVFTLWPQGYAALTAMLFHGFTLDPAPQMMSGGAFISGVLCIAILGYLLGAAYTLIFHVLATKLHAVEPRQHVPH